MIRGFFLVLDGLDGAGKSTQLDLLADWLSNRGEAPIRCRDPGGTAAGDAIRSLLLGDQSVLSMRCEALLFFASRAQLVEEIVRPALAAGRIVLCDRYEAATLAYQGYAGGVDLSALRKAADLASGGLQPHWTGILDLDESAAAARSGKQDRIERRSADFHAKVRQGFLAEAALQPERFSVINADGGQDAVQLKIRMEVERVLAAATWT